MNFMLPALPGQAQTVEESDIYSAEIPPMSPSECGSCHPGQYGDLGTSGGGHKMECQKCHEIFHAFNPRKENFSDLMPDCAGCHGDVHGKREIGGCFSCHENAHAPGRIPESGQLAGQCEICHPLPGRSLEKRSGHTGQSCIECHHSAHGLLPDCSDCHAPHFPAQETVDCISCHLPHRPNDLRFLIDSDSRACHSCHQNIYARWRHTDSGHGTLSCTFCHVGHGQRPDCGECHGKPHGKSMTAGFRSCLGCHLDAHELPSRGLRR